MTEVGVRELRNNLSRYLDEVAEGAELVVTTHGRAIARLVAIDGVRPIDRLVAEGVVTPARSARRRRAPARVTASGSVSELVAEQRR